MDRDNYDDGMNGDGMTPDKDVGASFGTSIRWSRRYIVAEEEQESRQSRQRDREEHIGRGTETHRPIETKMI